MINVLNQANKYGFEGDDTPQSSKLLKEGNELTEDEQGLVCY